MADLLSALTEAAVLSFRNRTQGQPGLIGWDTFPLVDPVLAEAQRVALGVRAPEDKFAPLMDLAAADPNLKSLLSNAEAALDPMVLTPGGGSRMPPATMIQSLFTSALFHMYCLRLPDDESTFVRAVLDGFEELRRAARGERVRAYVFTGIALLTLPEGKKVSTPWGTLRPAPASRRPADFFFGRPRTTCILAEEKLVPVVFDRAPEPKPNFDAADLSPGPASALFPLACALGSNEAGPVAAPLFTWSTQSVPFQGGGFSFSSPPVGPLFGPEVDIGSRVADIEEWARIVDRAHVPAVDIAGRRLVSSAAHRADRGDALLDAVTVWENLLGTHTEVTFRVTSALAKLLEPNPSKRRDLRKQLGDIYDLRSKLVHGAIVEVSDVNGASLRAIDVAARALRASYRRGTEWLSMKSRDRCDVILLEWP